MREGGPSGEQPRTLWIGDLGYWMDETFLYNLFVATGAVTSVKIIRSKTTNVSEGYGFIEFTSHEAAAQVLAAFLDMCCGCRLRGARYSNHASWTTSQYWLSRAADPIDVQWLPYSGHRPDLPAQLGGLWCWQG